MMHTFQLVASIQNECCTGSHLWFQPIKARSPRAAGRKLARIIEKSGAQVFEIAEVSNQEWVWERPNDYTATFGKEAENYV